MYIVRQKNSAIVWDKAKNRPLAQFVDGVFETDDKAVADALAAAGYIVEYDGEPEADAEAETEPETPAETTKRKQKAKE